MQEARSPLDGIPLASRRRMSAKKPLKRIHKRELLKGLAVLVRDDQALTAKLLEYIGEVDRRQLYLELAYPSMFSFCVGRCGMSESMAAKRIRAGRAACRFPCILDMVRKGELHLTAVHQLVAYLTEENHKEVLRRAKGRTTREIDELIAEIAPRPDGRTVVREVLAPKRNEGSLLTRPDISGSSDPTTNEASGHEQMPAPERPPKLPTNNIRSVTVPLSPQRYRLHVTVGKEAVDDLEELTNLFSHKMPSPDAGQIVERALALLLEDTKKRRVALTKKPRKRKRKEKASRTRAIPAEVRREVFKRDEGRCAFVDAEGHRCNSAWKVEFHHVVPFGRNGPNTTDNLQLRCRAHNQYEAELEYGEVFMKKKRRKSA